MGRVAADELAKALELGVDLVGHGCVAHDALVVAVEVLPRAEVDVQADAEVGVGTRVARGVLGPRPADHQARAGHDPVLAGAHDPVIGQLAVAEVVGVDDQLGQSV